MTRTELQQAKIRKWERRVAKATLHGVSDDAWKALMAEDLTVTDAEWSAHIWKHTTASVVDSLAGRVFSHDPTGRCGWSHFRVVSAGRKPGTVRMRRVTKSGTTQKTVVVWDVKHFRGLRLAVESRTA